MTTVYHTPLVTGAAANAAIVNAPLATLDAELVAQAAADAALSSRLTVLQSSVLEGSAAVTLLSADVGAGNVLPVDDTSNFAIGSRVQYVRSDGVLEYNVIASIDSGTQLTLTTNIGASLVNNTVIAVIPESAYNAGVGIYNVLNYGASPSASGAVNSAAIQAAIDACDAASGGVVEIPAGTYDVASTLLITGDQVMLRGAGWSTILAGTSALAATPLLHFYHAGDYINFSGAENLKITLAHDSSIGVKFVQAIEPFLFRVYIQGNNAATNVGSGVIQDGIGSGAWSGGLRMYACRIAGNKYGVRLLNTTTSAHITDNWILGSSPLVTDAVGIYIDSTSGQGTIIKGNEIESWELGIDAAGATLSIVANRFETCNTYAIQTGANASFYMIMGNNYTLDCVNSIGNTFGLIFDYNEPCYIGTKTEGDVPLTIFGGAARPGSAVDLKNITYSVSSYLARFSALLNGATNEFGETISAHEVNLASSQELKVGTTSATWEPISFYVHGAKVGELDSSGILTLSNVKVGANQVLGARVVDARIDDTISSGDATTDGVIDALRDAMIAHGLIAAA